MLRYPLDDYPAVNDDHHLNIYLDDDDVVDDEGEWALSSSDVLVAEHSHARRVEVVDDIVDQQQQQHKHQQQQHEDEEGGEGEEDLASAPPLAAETNRPAVLDENEEGGEGEDDLDSAPPLAAATNRSVRLDGDEEGGEGVINRRVRLDEDHDGLSGILHKTILTMISSEEDLLMAPPPPPPQPASASASASSFLTRKRTVNIRTKNAMFWWWFSSSCGAAAFLSVIPPVLCLLTAAAAIAATTVLINKLRKEGELASMNNLGVVRWCQLTCEIALDNVVGSIAAASATPLPFLERLARIAACTFRAVSLHPVGNKLIEVIQMAYQRLILVAWLAAEKVESFFAMVLSLFSPAVGVGSRICRNCYLHLPPLPQRIASRIPWTLLLFCCLYFSSTLSRTALSTVGVTTPPSATSDATSLPTQPRYWLLGSSIAALEAKSRGELVPPSQAPTTVTKFLSSGFFSSWGFSTARTPVSEDQQLRNINPMSESPFGLSSYWRWIKSSELWPTGGIPGDRSYAAAASDSSPSTGGLFSRLWCISPSKYVVYDRDVGVSATSISAQSVLSRQLDSALGVLSTDDK